MASDVHTIGVEEITSHPLFWKQLLQLVELLTEITVDKCGGSRVTSQHQLVSDFVRIVWTLIHTIGVGLASHQCQVVPNTTAVRARVVPEVYGDEQEE